MFFLVLLSIFNTPEQWKWVEEPERISLGLELHPFCHFMSGENGGLHDIVFFDMDLDGDDDMLEKLIAPGIRAFRAYQHNSFSTQLAWKEKPELLERIDTSSDFVLSVSSLGAGDINGDGADELIIVTDGGYYHRPGVHAYVNRGGPGAPQWDEDSSLFESLDTTGMADEPDFADIDGDGDLDMVGISWRERDENYICDYLCLWWNRGTSENPLWEKDTTYFGDRWNYGNPCWIDWEEDGLWDVIYTQTGMADPPPMPGVIKVLKNNETATTPVWTKHHIHSRREMDDLALLDWNHDGVDDIFFPGDEFDGGYQYIQAEPPLDSTSYDFEHPIVMGGIIGDYPAVADLDNDGLPELTVTEMEHHMYWSGGPITHHFWSHFRTYKAENPSASLWKRDYNEGWYASNSGQNQILIPSADDSGEAHIQYVDFNTDGLLDNISGYVGYVPSFTGGHTLYLNIGTETEPDWQTYSIFDDIGPMMPSCFIDIDGDGEMDVVGEGDREFEDSTVIAYRNTGSGMQPEYSGYWQFVSGLPSSGIRFLRPADFNEDGLSDLAVGRFNGELTAYLNTGQENPRWERRDEVFESVEGGGNPTFYDMDSDGDLDLFIVQYDTDGRLRYYRNASDETGIVEEPVLGSDIELTHIGRELVFYFSDNSGEITLTLYNPLGQRVVEYRKTPVAGKVRFELNNVAGVYFYRAQSGSRTVKGKVILH